MRLQFVVDHCMDLLLQETCLLVVESALFLELGAECVFCHFEVVLHHHEWILEDVF